MAFNPGRLKTVPDVPSSIKNRVLPNPLSAAYFVKIVFWFVMELDSPSARSSTDNLQYKAVIFPVFATILATSFQLL
jgi:hypothetical protein